jgi:hypothetical protein
VRRGDAKPSERLIIEREHTRRVNPNRAHAHAKSKRRGARRLPLYPLRSESDRSAALSRIDATCQNRAHAPSPVGKMARPSQQFFIARTCSISHSCSVGRVVTNASPSQVTPLAVR